MKKNSQEDLKFYILKGASSKLGFALGPALASPVHKGLAKHQPLMFRIANVAVTGVYSTLHSNTPLPAYLLAPPIPSSSTPLLFLPQ